MTPDKFKAMIEASGGFTRPGRRGDRPQPLTKADERAFDKAWKKTAGTRQLVDARGSKRGVRSRITVKV